MSNPLPLGAVSDAVILMAGVGSRLGSQTGVLAKPLVRIGGRPLISYTFEVLQRAGVRNVHAVMGATSERLAAALRPLVPSGLQLHAIFNPDWQKQNGVSMLCAEARVNAPFFLVMGDHLFEFAILAELLAQGVDHGVSLAVDRKIESIFDLEDATKVWSEGDRVVKIGKELAEYNAIDTGVFLCAEEIFDFLKRAQLHGDCSLSDGMRLLAAEQKLRAVDVGEAWWQDVDTPEMLAHAEQESARLLRHNARALPQECIARES
jgi:choline kinase